MKKPWSTATTSEVIATGMERKCDGTHAREEARGLDCKLAEEKADAFARRVHLLVSLVAAEHVPLEDCGVAWRASAGADPSSSPAASTATTMAQNSLGSSAARDPSHSLRICASAVPRSRAGRPPAPAPATFRARSKAGCPGRAFGRPSDPQLRRPSSRSASFVASGR